ncbi:urease accessory protein UreH domain-containing protein [Anaeromicropila populeti]|uniref:Cytochrome C biogenesis protein transmembrane region n=1 Tax=Anaeromicropila populeti TaxID=37658 RepID=A0A1I6LIY1_9FIRM|nr:sulfite exporter TauE/SafE family protein [Anaeromicropila populeti]SFS03328.1 Cytochrome C biogenesis protein transmembrane region [Anaeromicropila populeti]
MGIAMMLQAGAVGLGCGTCCSPAISVFLSTYILSRGKGMKKSLFSFATFFLGKIAAVVLLCGIAAVVGQQFIDTNGNIGSFQFRFMLQLVTVGTGMLLVIKWFYDRGKTRSCKSCKGCGTPKRKAGKGELPVFTVGFLYGITPCAPLLMVLGYTAALSPVSAVCAGILFAFATIVTPVLLLVVISGVLSKKIAEEIPGYLEWLRLGCYVALTVFSFISLL